MIHFNGALIISIANSIQYPFANSVIGNYLKDGKSAGISAR